MVRFSYGYPQLLNSQIFFLNKYLANGLEVHKIFKKFFHFRVWKEALLVWKFSINTYFKSKFPSPFHFCFSILEWHGVTWVTECYHSLGTVLWRGLFVLYLVCFTSSLHTLECFQLQPRPEPCKVGSPLPRPGSAFSASKGARALASPACPILLWMATAPATAHPPQRRDKEPNKVIGYAGTAPCTSGSLTEKHCCLHPFLNVVYDT